MPDGVYKVTRSSDSSLELKKPRCATCKHWSQHSRDVENGGRCYASHVSKLFGLVQEPFDCDQNFGCVLHEEKQ